MTRTIFKDSVAYSPKFNSFLVNEKLIPYLLYIALLGFFTARTQFGTMQCHYFRVIISHKSLIFRISKAAHLQAAMTLKTQSFNDNNL